MRLTSRCMDILRLLRSARWLTTGQVHRRFFAPATVNAARRRLRSLAKAGYLRKHQEDRMREALYTLGREGKRLLERKDGDDIGLERQPPKQLEHLAGVNDVRIAAEMTDGLAFFFAAWELPAVGWKFPRVPDGLFRIAGRTFAVEYDRGLEGLRYFIGAKIAWYRDGLPGFPLSGVLVVAEGEVRMRTLARAIGEDRRFLFTTIGAIREAGLPHSICRRRTCPPEPSPRENGLIAKSYKESTGKEKTAMPLKAGEPIWRMET